MDGQSLDTMVLPETAEVPASSSSAANTFTSWFNTIKERLSGQEPWAVELVVFGLSGFVAGFLLKNFGRLVFVAALIAAAVFAAFHFTHIYEFPIEQLKAFFGIADLSSLQAIVAAKIELCKEHPVAVLSAVVGALVGWKVG